MRMDDPYRLSDFLSPVTLFGGMASDCFREGQLGRCIAVNEGELPDFAAADLVVVGCGERRGDEAADFDDAGPDAVRRSLYELFHWHRHLRIADAGNVRRGESPADTAAALRTVVSAILEAGSRALVIGGSHDLTLAQYEAYRGRDALIDVAVVDARLDLSTDLPLRSRHFLMELLTGEPNLVRHYSHIAFQSYLVNPEMLETMDKLRFDCFRLGRVREDIEEMEPVLRGCRMASFDIGALQHISAPQPEGLPNGLNGEEACLLASYAGMSPRLDSFGIYGYDAAYDPDGLAARQIAQMVWYYVDGLRRGLSEPAPAETEEFLSFHTAFAELDTVFLQSRRTGRWWMRLPDGEWLPCSRRDYLRACDNELPERWLRAQERG
jgi:arginase family enzyme